MTLRVQGATRRIRVVAALLIVGLAAGPASSHLYWLLGGTWGLYTRGARDEVATTGIRVVSALVLVLLVAAVLVVLARVGLWQQAFVSERMIRLFAWALAAVFLLETLAAFTWSRGDGAVVDVRAGLARDRNAGARRGGLGRRMASFSPATADAALTLKANTGCASVRECRLSGGLIGSSYTAGSAAPLMP